MKLAWTLALLALAAPIAAAQEPDPSVNESEFDTSEPPPDEQYLDDAEAEASGDPTVTESDFDMSEPTGDQAYLDEAEAEMDAQTAGTGGSATSAGNDRTPGLGLLVTLVAVGAIAISLRGRRG